MKTKPASYKFMVAVQKTIYEFMLTKDGVGSIDALFNITGKVKYYHNPLQTDTLKTRFVFYRRKREAQRFVAWLADWYFSAKTGEPMMFSQLNLKCK